MRRRQPSLCTNQPCNALPDEAGFAHRPVFTIDQRANLKAAAYEARRFVREWRLMGLGLWHWLGWALPSQEARDRLLIATLPLPFWLASHAIPRTVPALSRSAGAVRQRTRGAGLDRLRAGRGGTPAASKICPTVFERHQTRTAPTQCPACGRGCLGKLPLLPRFSHLGESLQGFREVMGKQPLFQTAFAGCFPALSSMPGAKQKAQAGSCGYRGSDESSGIALRLTNRARGVSILYSWPFQEAGCVQRVTSSNVPASRVLSSCLSRSPSLD